MFCTIYADDESPAPRRKIYCHSAHKEVCNFKAKLVHLSLEIENGEQPVPVVCGKALVEATVNDWSQQVINQLTSDLVS